MYEKLRVDFDIRRSLESLEAKDWGSPPFDSRLVVTCHALSKKSLCDFTIEDLRIMIGQNFSLPYLLPLAVHVLKNEPLAEGDYYKGDLLCAVLKCDIKENKNWATFAFELEDIGGRALKSMEHDANPSSDGLRKEIQRGIQKMVTIWKETSQKPK